MLDLKTWHTDTMEKTQVITITDINHFGQGVGRDVTGLTYFVDGALPGETAHVRPVRRSKSYVVAEVVRYAHKSQNRVQPRCPVADTCGGCSLQHLAYQAACQWKQERVREQLVRIGGVHAAKVEWLPLVAMDDPWRYRNKASYPVAMVNGQPMLGFYAERSHTLVPHDDCFVLPEAMNIIKREVEKCLQDDGVAPYDEQTHSGVLRHVVVRQSFHTNDLMLIFVVKQDDKKIHNWPERIAAVLAKESPARLVSAHLQLQAKRTNVIIGERSTCIYGEPVIQEELNGLTFNIRAEAFFQVNTKQAERMFATVKMWINSLPQKPQAALDLYCGSGSIALHVATLGIPVKGIEIVPGAILEAKANAKRNGLKNVEFKQADAVAYLTDPENAIDASLVILDPPRKGVDEKLLDVLINTPTVETIVYVSCNPATLARDVKYLADHFELVRVQPFDLFPHTTHVETVVLMSRTKN